MTRKLILFSLLSLFCTMNAACSSSRKKSPGSESEIQALIADLDSPNFHERCQAAERLGRVGPKASAAVPKLLDIVKKNEFDGLTIASISAIGGIEEGGREVDEQLLRYMEMKSDGDYRRVYYVALNAFNYVKTAPHERAEALLKNFDQCSEEQQCQRLRFLRRVGKHAAPALPHLLARIKKNGASTDKLVIQVLEAIGPAASPAIADLLFLSEHKEQSPYALDAIRAIGAPRQDDLSLVLFHVNSKHERTRLALVEVLMALGQDSKKVMTTFVKLLDDPSLKVRRKAIDAIGQIGPDAKSTLPRLIELRKSEDYQTLRAVEHCIRRVQKPEKAKNSVL